MQDRRGFIKTALRAALAVPFVRPVLAGVTLVRYPYLQSMRRGQVTVLWATSGVGHGVVEYSAGRSFDQSAIARIRELSPRETGLSFSYYRFSSQLTDLQPGTEYSYRIRMDGDLLLPADELHFRTADTGPFRFLAFGDSGQSTPQQAELALQMLQENPAFVLHMGDLVYPNSSFDQYEARYFGYYRELMKRVPFFPCPGNHEYNTPGAIPYITVHSVPTDDVPPEDAGRYYSFDWGNVHFVSLDSNLPLVRAAQGDGSMLAWLDNDLKKTRQFWKIVYFHHPPFAGGPNQSDPLSVLARQHIAPLMERHGVHLVLNGHEHSYQRSLPVQGGVGVNFSGGPVYVTTGGGGASCYEVFPHPDVIVGLSAHHYVRTEVSGSALTLKAVDQRGKQIDEVSLHPLPLLAENGVVCTASSVSGLAPGMPISIAGRNLAGSEDRFPGFPGMSLPLELDGIRVRLNGQDLPLFYVSPTQVDAQLPFDFQGTSSLELTTPNGTVTQSVTVGGVAPALLSRPTWLGPYPPVVHANGTPVSESNPAFAGEQILIYVTGLGRVNGPIAAGRITPVTPVLSPLALVEVKIGGTTVFPTLARLAPGFVGLYEVRVIVPNTAENGTHLVQVLAAQVSSNSAPLVVLGDSLDNRRVLKTSYGVPPL